MNVAGCVVLYNPDKNVISSINSYIDQIEVLLVIDNSEQTNVPLIDKIKSIRKVIYINQEGNKGIANALNKAANVALELGFNHLLTMDQDTYVPADMVQKFKKFLQENESEKIGIVAGQTIVSKFGIGWTYVPFAITSGNLINLSAYKVCGPFLEALFIDWVDHEYCLRLIKNNFFIVELNDVELTHNLGDVKYLYAGKRIVYSWISHSPIRIYYKIRNILYVMQIHANIMTRNYIIICLSELCKEFFKAVCFEDKKVMRLKLIMKAIFDQYRRKLGSINNPVYV